MAINKRFLDSMNIVEIYFCDMCH